MAGEWIKVEIGLPEKPEVLKVARLLNIHRDQVVGTMVRFWAWAGANSVDGFVTHVALRDVDDVVGCQGFASALRSVGWLLEAGENRLSIPNFDRHNGQSAKKRALTSSRQERFRNAPVDASVTLTALPEKRREEKKQETPPANNAGPLWGDSLAILTEQGFSEKSARAFIGGLCREYGESDVVDAVRASMGKANCPAYIRGVLKSKPKRGESGLKVAMP
jgi:hypothetical protein